MVHMSTTRTISEWIVPTTVIPYPVGDPNLLKDEEYTLRKKM